MIQIKNKVECSGCYSCYNICPQSCIAMISDAEGFSYPEVLRGNCIDCGLCEEVCPILNSKEENPVNNTIYPKAYACYNLKDQIRKKSSSGGMFFPLASWILKNRGIVYGAAFDKEMTVRHIGVEREEELNKLQGAKYVQSKIGDTYLQVKEQLKRGRMVYFSGTPCQIDGLLFYLQQQYDNLICQDIVCHGVPSPKVWEYYLKYRNEIFGKEPISVNFRDKKHGWKAYDLRIDYSDGVYRCDHWNDPYMKAFLRNYILRPSCYKCHSKSIYRKSDITLADFWGIEHVLPSLDDDKGISLVLINSKKGENVFSEVLNIIEKKEVGVDEAIKYNPSAYQSVQLTDERELFMKQIFEGDFEKVVRKFINEKGIMKGIKWIKSIFSRNISCF